MPTVNGLRVPDFAINFQPTPLPTLAATKAITGASNATPIVITAVGHGYSNGDIVLIAGVGGNTAANGFRIVSAKLTDSFTALNLDGTNTIGNADYTAGGTAAKFSATPVIASKSCWIDKIRVNNTTNGAVSITVSTNESPTPRDLYTAYQVAANSISLEIDDTAQPEFCNGGAVIYASATGLNATVNAWRKP